MSHSELKLRFEDDGDGDGTGTLVALAKSGWFSGEGGAYFDINQVQEFAKAITRFPLAGRPALSSGLGETEHLGIEVYPIDCRGHIGVQVRMSTELWDGMRNEAQCMARVQVLTTYGPLAEFGQQLTALLAGDLDEVILSGER